MTLNKYIRRLADKLNRHKQYEREVADLNARRARANRPEAMPKHSVMSRLLAIQHRRYGLPFGCKDWDRRGLKNAKGQLQPIIRK